MDRQPNTGTGHRDFCHPPPSGNSAQVHPSSFSSYERILMPKNHKNNGYRGDSYVYKNVNTDNSESRAEISDTENDRILRNPWADINNNVSCHDQHQVRRDGSDTFDGNRSNAFSSQSPSDRRAGDRSYIYDYNRPNTISVQGPYDWRTGDNNRSQFQPRHHQTACHAHVTRSDKNVNHFKNNIERHGCNISALEYNSKNHETRTKRTRDPGQRYKHNENKRDYTSKPSLAESSDKFQNRSYEPDVFQERAPYHDRNEPQVYDPGPHYVPERNRNRIYERGHSQRIQNWHRFPENKRMLDSFGAKTTKFLQSTNDSERMHNYQCSYIPAVDSNNYSFYTENNPVNGMNMAGCVPLKSSEIDWEQDIMNNNPTLWQQENIHVTEASEFFIPYLSSVGNENQSDAKVEDEKFYPPNGNLEYQHYRPENIISIPHYNGENQQKNLAVNGNVQSNSGSKNYDDGNSHSDAQDQNFDLDVSLIPLPDELPVQNIVHAPLTHFPSESNKMLRESHGCRTNAHFSDSDPFQIEKNLSLIKQQCYKSDDKFLNNALTIPQARKGSESKKQFGSETDISMGVDITQTLVRNEFHNVGFSQHLVGNHMSSEHELPGDIFNSTKVSETSDFSFLRYPPPPLPLSLSNPVATERPLPLPTTPFSKTTTEKSSHLPLQVHEQFKNGIEQMMPQQPESSDYSFVKPSKDKPATESCSDSVGKRIPEIEDKFSNKVPPLPPHKLIQKSETEFQIGKMSFGEDNPIQPKVTNTDENVIVSSDRSNALEQKLRENHEQSLFTCQLQQKGNENQAYRIPLKGKVNSGFRPFRPWTSSPRKDIIERNKMHQNHEQRKNQDKAHTLSVNEEFIKIATEKRVHEGNNKKALKQASTKMRKQNVSKRASNKHTALHKSNSKRKRKRNTSKLMKLLSKSMPYLELCKLSEIAKPKVNTLSRGLTSVVNQNLVPKILSLVLPVNETNDRTDNVERYVRKTHIKTEMEFHKLGLGNRSMLKPNGEQTGTGLRNLKSTLNLGSMENLNKIAKGIKQNAKRLEKHKSFVNKIKHLNYKPSLKNEPKEKGSNLKSELLKGDSHINLASLHPKLRHKIEKLSVGSPVEIDEELINTLPKVSVIVKKCDDNASSDKIQIKPQKQNYINKWKKKENKLHGVKIKKSYKYKTEKESFMEKLELQKKSVLQKKIVNLPKRGKFTMQTPTTFIVNTPKANKSRHAEACHKDESDGEDESNRLAKACEAARQCLLKRQQQPGILPQECSEKSIGNNDNSCADSKLAIDSKSSNKLKDNSHVALAEIISKKQTRLFEELPGVNGMKKEENDMRVTTAESDIQLKKYVECSDYRVDVEETSTVSFNSSLRPASLDVSKASYFPRSYAEMEVKKSRKSFEQAVSTNFSVDSLITSDGEKSENHLEGKFSEANVYHIEHKNDVSLTGYPAVGYKTSVWASESPEITEIGPGNYSSEYPEKQSAAITSEWKKDIIHDAENLETRKVDSVDYFVAIPLEMQDNQDEQLPVVPPNSILDFGPDGSKNNETGISFLPYSQSKLDDCMNRTQNKTKISSKICLSELNEPHVKVYDIIDTNTNITMQQQSYEPMIVDDDLHNESLYLVDESKNDLVRTENQILENSCKRNFFESFVDDVMHDEALMKTWTGEVFGKENSDVLVNDHNQLEETPVLPDSNNIGIKKISGCKSSPETEMFDSEDMNINEVRATAAFNEVVKSFSPVVQLKRIDHFTDTASTNSEEKKFVSERIPVKANNYRKRKYVKRFPVPLPRTKNKNHENEKQLYEAAKKFLGDFNDTVKRACRMKKEIKNEENTSSDKTDLGQTKLSQQEEEDVKSSQGNTEQVQKDNSEKTDSNNVRGGHSDDAKKINAGIVQNDVINANKTEITQDICKSKNETNFDLCSVTLVEKGTKHKSPVLRITKASIKHDLPFTENEIRDSENDNDGKRLKVENRNLIRKDSKSKTNKKGSCEIKWALGKKKNDCEDIDRWCAKCNTRFPSLKLKKRHLRNDHDVKTPCLVCGVEYGNRTTYRRHLLSQLHLKNVKQQRGQSHHLKAKKSDQKLTVKKSSSNQVKSAGMSAKMDTKCKKARKQPKLPDQQIKKTKVEKSKACCSNPKKKKIIESENVLTSPKQHIKNIKSKENLLRSPKLHQKKSVKEKKTVLKSPKLQSQMTSPKVTVKLLKSPKLNLQKDNTKEIKKLLNSPKLKKQDHKQSLALKISKSKKLAEMCQSPKTLKVKSCNRAKSKVSKVKNSNKVTTNSHEEEIDLERKHYCTLCNQSYHSSSALSRHTRTNKHIGAAETCMTKNLEPLATNKPGRKESSSSDVNSSVDYSESEYYQDLFTPEPEQQPTSDAGFYLPAPYFEFSEGENLRQLALHQPTFLVKNINHFMPANTYRENQPPETCTYLGLGINSQQSFEGQGYIQRHLNEGEGHLSSSAIGGLVRESYISLLSSEDENMDPSYEVYHNLDSASERENGADSNDNVIGQVSADGTYVNSNEQNTASRTISISSDDSDYSENVLSGASATKVTKLRTPPLSPNPICRIKNCFSLA